ncbi:hypothetical protein RhiirB3_533373 [Rhizophagus irregularis]|nr:hypothetical protein RhiirB3_533373 [Rhizophagus irregularis]
MRVPYGQYMWAVRQKINVFLIPLSGYDVITMFSGIAFICEFIFPELQAISTIWDSLILTEIHYITLPGLSIKQSGEKKFVYAYFPMLLQC